MQKKLLFVIYPTISHYTSIFAIAAAYKNKGFSIYITGRRSDEKLIFNQGFNFLPFDYYETYLIRNWKVAFYLFIKNSNPSFVSNEYRRFLTFGRNLYCLANKTEFDKILIDAHLSYYYIFIPNKKKTLIINTKLSTISGPCIPPLPCGLLVKRNWLFKQLSSIIWVKKYLNNFIRNSFRKIICRGKDEHTFIKKFLSSNGYFFNDIFLGYHSTCFYYELDLNKTKVHTLITACRQVEYKWKKLHPYERYLDLELYHLPWNERWEQTQLALVEEFIKSNKYIYTKAIYCSFGTITARFQKKVTNFIHKICLAFGNNRRYIVFISTGELNIEIDQTYKNILISKKLPQFKVLKLCDLAITHGGMNTIKECLFLKLPLLVYPLNNNFDQPGNAARIQSNKLGLKGNMRFDSIKKIRRKANFLLNGAWDETIT